MILLAVLILDAGVNLLGISGLLAPIL